MTRSIALFALAALVLVPFALPSADASGTCVGASTGTSCTGAYLVLNFNCQVNEVCTVVDYACVGIHTDHCAGFQWP
jgi:hypothetical protein